MRRRHTVFPNRDLSQPRGDSDEEETTVTVDQQTRPRLDGRPKCQSFHHRPAITATQPLQPAAHADVMAEDSVASPTLGAST